MSTAIETGRPAGCIREGMDDEALGRLVSDLRADNDLCNVTEDPANFDPRIICSLGLRGKD